MRTEIIQKTRALLLEEVDRMRDLGAADEDIKEDVFIEMMATKVAKASYPLLTEADKKAMWFEFVETASPEQLRESAARCRESGLSDAAYDLELLADQRERE
jgi:hypothetical protein